MYMWGAKMKEVFRYIKNTNKKYKISNYGRIYSLYSERFLTLTQSGYSYYYRLNGIVYNVSKLVLQHFKPKQIPQNSTLCVDGNFTNNKSNNLEWSNRGDRLRLLYTIKNKQRGVYNFKIRMGNKIYSRYRAVLKIDNRTVTLGYFKTKKEAYNTFIESFLEWYGYFPFHK